MIRLLRSNFSRLIKYKPFYIVLGVQAALMLFITISFYITGLNTDEKTYADGAFIYTVCTPFAAAMLAIMCSLFIGSDYSNGTIRNKLHIGFSRSRVYLANLITMMTVALCMNIAAMAIFYPVSLPLLGGFGMQASELLKIFFCGTLIMLVYASIYTAVAMTSRSTVIALIVTVLTLFVMFLMSQYMLMSLNEPPMFDVVRIDPDGNRITETIINPARKSDGVLAFFKVLLNIFPTGQIVILSSEYFSVWAIFGSLGILGISTAVGLAVFSKENLK